MPKRCECWFKWGTFHPFISCSTQVRVILIVKWVWELKNTKPKSFQLHWTPSGTRTCSLLSEMLLRMYCVLLYLIGICFPLMVSWSVWILVLCNLGVLNVIFYKLFYYIMLQRGSTQIFVVYNSTMLETVQQLFYINSPHFYISEV